MQNTSKIFSLIIKEYRYDWRSRSALSGMLMYVFATVFICYLSFKNVIDIPTWNALFWIIILFVAINAIAKSFMAESKALQLFYYSFLSPNHIIVSKITYHAALMFVLAATGSLIFIFFLGNPVQSCWQFSIALLLGSVSFSSCLTMISAIASRATNNPALLAVFGFPVLLPVLTVTIRFSKNAIDGLAWSVNQPYFILLLCLNVLILALAYLLFPYLWRE